MADDSGCMDIDRRALLGKGAVVGGLAWTAPLLLSTAAGAQGSTPTTTEPPPTTEPPDTPFAPTVMAGKLANSFGVGTSAVLVADAAGRLRRSTDEAATWTDPLGGGVLPVSPVALAMLKNRGAIHSFFAFGADGSVFRSTDLGATWVAETAVGIAPAVVTAEAELFYVGVPGGAGPALMVVDALGDTRVADAGVSPLVWTDPGGAIGIVPAAIGAAHEPHVAVAADGRVRTSVDRGATWIDPMGGGAMPVTPGALPVTIGGLYVGGSGTIGVADSLGQMRTSTDGGATWGPVSSVSGVAGVIGIAGGGRIVAVGSAGDVRITSDGGSTWSTPSGSPIT